MKAIPELLQFQNYMDCVIYCLYLACFVVKYICDIYLSMLDFNGLCKFNNILTKLLYAGLYNYNGRQIQLFYTNGLMVDKLTGPRLMSL